MPIQTNLQPRNFQQQISQQSNFQQPSQQDSQQPQLKHGSAAEDSQSTAPPQSSDFSAPVNLDSQRKPLETSLSQSSFNLGAAESIVTWDKWHHRVGKAISKNVKKATIMMNGFVAFDVLITRENALSTHVTSATNRKMADACVSAAQSLSGDPVLAFPPESKRRAVQFRFEYKRGFVLIPHNQYITGDFEHLNDEGH
jgi:hypothetical protein